MSDKKPCDSAYSDTGCFVIVYYTRLLTFVRSKSVAVFINSSSFNFTDLAQIVNMPLLYKSFLIKHGLHSHITYCIKGVCALEVRGAMLSFAYKRTSERWLLWDSDHFNIEDRRKQMLPYLVKDMKLARTGSPGLQELQELTTTSQYSRRSPELRRAACLWR